MTREEYFEYAEKAFARALELSKKKNADYTADSDDPFANFKASEAVLKIDGLTEYGFLTRIMDKYMRLGSFVKNGKLDVEDESVQDTLLDMANYSFLFMGYLKSKGDTI